MAFGIHWQIPFKSLRADTNYVVNIWQNGYTGSAVVLKGGAQPFTTQEDDNEDMFTPIRTQTGYIRIVDDGYAADGVTVFNWKDLLPNTDTDRPVTLTANGTVVWQGFMQAQNFGGTLYGGKQEREFPVHCPLTILEGTDINYQQKEIQNFAYLLQQITNCIATQGNGAGEIQNVIIQGNTDARTWLLKRIDWQNFADEDGDGNLIARFNLYQCLEDLCRFWGWTARTYRKNLYLTRADDTAEPYWLSLTMANLSTLASGSSAGTTNGPFVQLNLTGDIFASTDQDDFRQRGPNRATVKADANKADEEFLMFAPDKFIKTMIDGGWQSRISDDGMYVRYTVDKTTCSLPLMTGEATSGNASFNVANIQESLTDDGNQVPVIRIKKTAASSAYASLETVYQHSFKGYIMLRGDIYRKAHKFESQTDSSRLAPYGNKTMIMRLGIGPSRSDSSTKWWNGQQWTTTQSTFTVAIGGTDGILWIKTTNFYNASFAVTAAGKIFIDFLGSTDLEDVDGQKSFEIANFSLTITQSGNGRLLEDEWVSTKQYKSNNQNNVRMDWNADCIYATDNNMVNGFGVLLNADNSHMENAPYNGTNKRPEQQLADRVTTFWASAKRKLEVELRSDLTINYTLLRDVSPQNKCTLDSTTCYPIAVGHEWCDDITRLTLLQIS